MGYYIETFDDQIILNYSHDMDYLLTIFLYHSFLHISIFLIIVQLHLLFLLFLQLPIFLNNDFHFLPEVIRIHLVIIPYFLQMVLNFQLHTMEVHKVISLSWLKMRGPAFYLHSNSTLMVFHRCRATYLKRKCYILCC